MKSRLIATLLAVHLLLCVAYVVPDRRGFRDDPWWRPAAALATWTGAATKYGFFAPGVPSARRVRVRALCGNVWVEVPSPAGGGEARLRIETITSLVIRHREGLRRNVAQRRRDPALSDAARRHDRELRLAQPRPVAGARPGVVGPADRDRIRDVPALAAPARDLVRAHAPPAPRYRGDVSAMGLLGDDDGAELRRVAGTASPSADCRRVHEFCSSGSGSGSPFATRPRRRARIMACIFSMCGMATSREFILLNCLATA